MPEVVDESVNFYRDWFHYLFVEDPIWRRYNILCKDFIRKKKITELAHEREQLDNFITSAYRPTRFVNVLNDNWFRLFALSFVERFVTLRQTASYTSSSFAQSGFNTTLASSVNDLRGSNIVRGPLRGTFLNFFQWTGTYYASLVMSNGSPYSFLAHLLLMETIWHPFDTLRTRFVADGRNRFSNFVDVMRGTNMSQLYNGLAYRLIWSSALGFSLINTANGGDNLVSLGALLVGYPFLTLKCISQVRADQGSLAGNLNANLRLMGTYMKPEGIRSMYSGVLPYMAMAMYAGWHFPSIWNEDHKQREYER